MEGRGISGSGSAAHFELATYEHGVQVEQAVGLWDTATLGHDECSECARPFVDSRLPILFLSCVHT